MIYESTPNYFILFQEILKQLLSGSFSPENSSYDGSIKNIRTSSDSTYVPTHLIDISLQLFHLYVGQAHTRLRRSFVTRLVRRANISRQAFIISLLYMKRLLMRTHKSPGFFELCKKNTEKLHSEKLFLIAMAATGKFLYDDGDDEQLTNSDWAIISGRYSLDCINALERDFMAAMDWDVHVTLAAYNDFVEELITMQQKQTQRLCAHSFISYKDLGRLEEILTACHDNMVHAIARQTFNHHSQQFLTDTSSLYDTPPSTPGQTPDSIPTISPQMRAYLNIVTPLHAGVYMSMCAMVSLALYCSCVIALHTITYTVHHVVASPYAMPTPLYKVPWSVSIGQPVDSSIISPNHYLTCQQDTFNTSYGRIVSDLVIHTTVN